MKYLITGGAGFIGSHLSESLLGDGHSVTIVDNYSTSTPDNIAHLAGASGLRVEELDVVESPDKIDTLVRESDCVIHLAAAVGVELVVKDPVRTITTNVHGTENVLIPAAKYGKRVVVASTSEVYGKSSHEKFSETDDLLIGSPMNSRWSYACSKLLDEFYLMAYQRTGAFPGTVVRFFNTVGPRQTGRYGMVVPRFVGAALRGEPIFVYGDGGQSRCFCHVRDVVRALKLLLAEPGSVGQVFNIGSQELVSILELAHRVVKLTGSRSPIKFLSYDEAYEQGFEDMRRRCPDTDKLHGLTGWRPESSLDDIIRDVADDLRRRR
ncbi:MAG: GDP-mannose 4,6-dehydratase [Lentisphaeria bacterium]|nr:GDP-mannose 4,6-dehydratase [Lentisphaeria bacterium]